MKSLIFFLLICSFFRHGTASSQSRPLVVTTIAPHAFLVSKLGGEAIRVETIVPKTANAHLYEPTPKEVAKLKDAHLWLRMGEALEEKLHSLLNRNCPHLSVLETWQGLPLIVHPNHSNHSAHCGNWDRHLWLSPRMMKRQIPRIASELIKLVPKNKSLIEKREKELLDACDILDHRIASLLALKKRSAILVAHPSFSYFCRDYGLEQLSLEFEGKDPLPKHLQKIFSKAKSRGVKKIFVQPQFPQNGAKRFADKLALPLYTMDPYDDDIFKTLETFAKAIAEDVPLN